VSISSWRQEQRLLAPVGSLHHWCISQYWSLKAAKKNFFLSKLSKMRNLERILKKLPAQESTFPYFGPSRPRRRPRVKRRASSCCKGCFEFTNREVIATFVSPFYANCTFPRDYYGLIFTLYNVYSFSDKMMIFTLTWNLFPFYCITNSNEK